MVDFMFEMDDYYKFKQNFMGDDIMYMDGLIFCLLTESTHFICLQSPGRPRDC